MCVKNSFSVFPLLFAVFFFDFIELKKILRFFLNYLLFLSILKILLSFIEKEELHVLPQLAFGFRLAIHRLNSFCIGICAFVSLRSVVHLQLSSIFLFICFLLFSYMICFSYQLVPF